MLQLIYAPHPIFKTICTPVAQVNDEVRALVDAMFKTLEHEHAVGLGAPMVGITQRIAIVDLRPNGQPQPHTFINPEIVQSSAEMQTFEEASICFPGISAEISRPNAITVKYLNYHGQPETLEAEGFFATVIQHEIDYLNGKIFLDYLSRMKRDMLLKKMQKHMKQHPPHVHGPGCNH